jgi:very-short-patch-repair endonuclease
MPPVHPAAALSSLGGVASLRALLALTTRKELLAAVGAGEVERLTRDRYALRTAEEGARAAGRLSGVSSHLSAAAWWRWPVLDVPAEPQVVVPRHRTVTAERRAGVDVRFRDLGPGDRREPCITSPLRTVLDCARDLSWAEGLAVADSALRSGLVSPEELRAAASRARGPGSVQVRRVAEQADARAANPFESALRAICLDVPGLEVVPQHAVQLPGFTIHPDLVDVRLRLIIEADSFTFHSSAAALLKDCERYTLCAAAGWRVARFGYFHVRRRPEWVHETLTLLAASAPGMAQPGREVPGPA